LEVGTDVLAVVGSQLLEQLLLLFRKPIGDLDLHSSQEVPGLAPAGVEPFALDPEDAPARRARRDLHPDRAVHRGHRDARPQGGLGVGDGHRDRQVLVAAPEQGMGGHSHVDQQVAGRPAVAARRSLARDADRGAVLHAGWNPDPDRSGAHLGARSPAHRARLVDDHTGATALRARLGEREETLVAGHRAGAVAGGAGSGPAGRFGAAAAAVGTRRLAPHLQRGGDAAERLLEGDRQVGAGVGAPHGPGAAAAPSREQVAEPAETAEEVAQVLDADLLATEPAEAAEAAGAAAPESGGDEAAHLVVLLALLGVGEDRVRLRDFLETLFGFRVAGVGVGVELLGELAIGALDLLLGGVGRHLQDGVEVLLHPVAIHCSSLSCVSSSASSASSTYSTATSAGRTRRPFRRYPRRSSSLTTRRPEPSFGAMTASWISGSNGSPTGGTISSPWSLRIVNSCSRVRCMPARSFSSASVVGSKARAASKVSRTGRSSVTSRSAARWVAS